MSCACSFRFGIFCLLIVCCYKRFTMLTALTFALLLSILPGGMGDNNDGGIQLVRGAVFGFVLLALYGLPLQSCRIYRNNLLRRSFQLNIFVIRTVVGHYCRKLTVSKLCSSILFDYRSSVRSAHYRSSSIFVVVSVCNESTMWGCSVVVFGMVVVRMVQSSI